VGFKALRVLGGMDAAEVTAVQGGVPPPHSKAAFTGTHELQIGVYQLSSAFMSGSPTRSSIRC